MTVMIIRRAVGQYYIVVETLTDRPLSSQFPQTDHLPNLHNYNNDDVLHNQFKSLPFFQNWIFGKQTKCSQNREKQRFQEASETAFEREMEAGDDCIDTGDGKIFCCLLETLRLLAPSLHSLSR